MFVAGICSCCAQTEVSKATAADSLQIRMGRFQARPLGPVLALVRALISAGISTSASTTVVQVLVLVLILVPALALALTLVLVLAKPRTWDK